MKRPIMFCVPFSPSWVKRGAGGVSPKASFFVFFTLITSILSFQIISCGSAGTSQDNQSPQTGISAEDLDGDGILNTEDICPNVKNAKVNLSVDTNHDGVMDECTDRDGDGIADGIDNCVTVKNADQKDSNHNGVGDTCAEMDTDCDGIKDDLDVCPYSGGVTSFPIPMINEQGQIIGWQYECSQTVGQQDLDGNKIPDNEPAWVAGCPIS